MKPAPFQWHPASSLDEAVALLARYAPEDGRVIAGGQSLVPSMALRVALPAHLIDINGIASLARLEVEAGRLSIGACVRHAAFEHPVEPGVLGRLLATVAANIAHAPIRTRGTFCGSLANADPASEWCLVAATLGATLVAVSARGTREVAAADWFHGIMTTALAEDELLAEARLPLLETDARAGFHEFSRRAGDYALAMSLCTFRVVEPQPRRIPEAERLLEGERPEPETFARVARAAADAVDPLEDIRTRAAYRRDLVAASVRRSLQAACDDTH
jgi:carbon-monoxide dehydrogenase medium subunit